MPKPSPALDHFREHLHDETDDCMVWPFSTNTHGYGQIKLDGRVSQVPVLACEAHHGPKPSPAHEAAHGPCHDRRCWNGRHLSWKTRAENLADKVRDGTHQQGEAIVQARLTEADVLAIRAAYAEGGVTQADLAQRYGVVRTVVSRIVNRRIWRHI